MPPSLFSIETLRSYWDVMQPEDAQVVVLSFLATLVLGGAVVGGFVWFAMRLDDRNTKARIKKEEGRIDRVLAERAARQGRKYTPVTSGSTKSITAAKPKAKDSKTSTTESAPQKKKTPLPAPSEKRHIPVESQSLLLQKGREELASGQADKALVNYLTLLYSAAENRDGSALPANLTECLRGAAECYKRLGQPENAVKFLQAERRVFEEAVVSAAQKEKGEGQKRTGGILASLLNPAAGGGVIHEEDLPKRCRTLSSVAEACTQLGRHDVALAYRVKAAAVSQKVTGKPLDEKSPEMVAMAAALAKVRAMGLGTDKVLKEVTSGEDAVRYDDPLLVQMLKDRGIINNLSAAAASSQSDTPLQTATAASGHIADVDE